METQNIKTSGDQLFNVPNDEFGKQFLQLARKYLNKKKYFLKSRGRAKNRWQITKKLGEKYYRRDTVPLESADWLAVYRYKKCGEDGFPISRQK